MISFRFLDLQADLERVHGWMQQPHVLPWWGLGGPVGRVREYLVARERLAHLDCWIASDDGTPFAYVETYRIPDDPLAGLYDALPGDRGFRLLVGPPELLGSGAAQRLVCHLLAKLLEQYAITRVLCEADVRNVRLLAFCRSLGAEEVATLDLPGRHATLLGWTSRPRAAAAA